MGRGRGLIAAAVASALLSLAASPSTRPTTRPATAPAAGPAYLCPRASAAIQIDGRLNDPAWTSAEWTSDFVKLGTGGRPDLRTRAKLLYDDRYLYIAAELEDAHVHASASKRDTVLYVEDNVLEVFLDPDGDARNYCEFQVNARGTLVDLLMDKPYRDHGHPDIRWDAAGLRAAVHVRGTLNDPSDRDEGWSVEMAIPFEALAAIAGRPCPPRAGDTWRFNVARCQHDPVVVAGRYQKPTGEMHYSTWAPQPEINLHAPEHWGFLTFVPAPAGHEKQ